jgi:hypothetical protein
MAVVTKIATTNFGCMVGSSGHCDDAALMVWVRPALDLASEVLNVFTESV